MKPSPWPKFYGEAVGTARLKTRPDDFQVEEVLGFDPSGDGEHALLWIEKIDHNSNDVATWIAKSLGIRRRLVSHCGLKDKSAVTRQWFSVHLPGMPSPTPDQIECDGIRVLQITRNLRKLNRGVHQGNRFVIRLRDCTFSQQQAEIRLARIARHGVPNYFGAQRFGIGGQNIEQSRRMFNGETVVNDRALRGILISAARSQIFNAVLARRLIDGTWDRPLDGDVFGFGDNRSLVLPDNTRGDEADRVASGALDITAPLWGQGELPSRGVVRLLEQSVADKNSDLARGLGQLNLRQERRVVRLMPQKMVVDWEDSSTLVLQFELPKGTYATTVIEELASTHEATTPDK